MNSLEGQCACLAGVPGKNTQTATHNFPFVRLRHHCTTTPPCKYDKYSCKVRMCSLLFRLFSTVFYGYSFPQRRSRKEKREKTAIEYLEPKWKSNQTKQLKVICLLEKREKWVRRVRTWQRALSVASCQSLINQCQILWRLQFAPWIGKLASKDLTKLHLQRIRIWFNVTLYPNNGETHTGFVLYSAATLALGQVSPKRVDKNRSGVFELYSSVIFLITVEEVCAFMKTNSEQQSGPLADRRYQMTWVDANRKKEELRHKIYHCTR